MDKKCPYCNVRFSVDGVYPDRKQLEFYKAKPYGLRLSSERPEKVTTIIAHLCPSCRKEIIWLHSLETIIENTYPVGEEEEYILLFPKEEVVVIPDEIPEEFASIYKEAKKVLSISPRASAALSRRCLQQLIRKVEGIEKRNLSDEIKELIQRNKIPKYLSADLDSIRQIGNFAAHPVKDQNTGEILEVEPGEAEWNLDVLYDLLQFYYIQVERSNNRRCELLKKTESKRNA